MILKIKYQIRFPLGSFLKDDPKYLIIKKIYSEIRRILCVNDNNCKECSKKDRCLYYLLSGNNFETYPSILVKRNFLEKKKPRPIGSGFADSLKGLGKYISGI